MVFIDFKTCWYKVMSINIDQGNDINLYMGLFISAGMIALYNGSVFGMTLCWGIIPFLWTVKCYKRFHASSQSITNDNNVCINERVIILSEKLAKLSIPIFEQYNSEDTYNEKLAYLDTRLRQTGYLSAVEELAKIDPRLQLTIVNKDAGFVIPSGKIVVPVNIRDNSWLGSPTENTCIINVQTSQ